MELFWKYIKGRKKIIGAACLFCAVFAVVFWLYRLPLAAVSYPAGLCACIGILFLFLDYRKVKSRHQRLEEAGRLGEVLTDRLPPPEKIEEEDYQSLIAGLKEEIGRLETESDKRYRDMTEYYTMWVHQIKTPIASMRLQLQKEDTPAARRLRAELFRIEQYVEMVLAFLRLESVSNDYVFGEYSVDDIVRQAVRKFAHEFIDRKLNLDYEPIQKRVVTDEKWLSFVLEQVLSNALKYTKEGGIRIYMEEGEVLCVEDTGIGIAPEDMPRIFENGYTGCNGRSDKKASGIGLYLCRRVCDNLGIEISAKSRVGEGTVIRMAFAQYEGKKE